MAKSRLTAKHNLTKQIEEFLDRHVTADDGDWPEVTDDQMTDLWHIIDNLIDAKFARTIDGYAPVEFTISRAERGTLVHYTLPDKPMDNLEQAMAVLQQAVGYADHAVRRIAGRVQLEEAEKRNAREWLARCENIVAAAEGPLAGTPLAQVLLRWATNSILDTGFYHKEDFWGPLSLTKKWVHEAYFDREDRNEPFNTIDAACRAILEAKEPVDE